jgi:phosphoglycolate phosphatase
VDVSAIKAVAFDCDGVLFDSRQANRNYYDQILNHVGLPNMSDDQFAFAHMHTVDETVTYLIRDPQKLAAADEYRKKVSYIPFIRHMVVEPYLHDLLTRLRPDYKTAIATNRTNTMQRVLDEHRLASQFDFVVTAQDVRHPKPHPECLLAVLAHFGLDPHEMVYIGDSELDAQASWRAGVPFIAFANETLAADVYVDRLDQVARLLNV